MRQHFGEVRHARHRFSVPRTAQQLMDRRSAFPPSPSDPPRRDRSTRQISDFPPNFPRSHSPVHGDPSVRAFPGQGGPSGTVRPAPPIRGHKRERAKRPPRRPTRADSSMLPVNEKTRLDFEAGLELPQLDLNQQPGG